MIYTVTFNPSLDYVVKVDDFAVGEINRTQAENIYPGGKGINVSLVLQNLGLQSVALGFTAGFSGRTPAPGGRLPLRFYSGRCRLLAD